MRSVNFSGGSVSKFRPWQTLPAKQSEPELASFAMQYQPLPAQPKSSLTELPLMERLKKAFSLREDHVKWMEKAQSGLGLPASMSLSLLEKSGRR